MILNQTMAKGDQQKQYAKQILRRDVRHMLNNVPESLLREHSAKITHHIAQHLASERNNMTLAVFAAHGKEVDLSSLHLLLPNAKLVYPLCHHGSLLTFHAVNDITDLEPGTLGIREPDPSRHTEVSSHNIDLILCPGLAFTPQGMRLGQGGGYYDRYLSSRPSSCQAWGVCMDTQVHDNVPVDDHDQPMDLVVTESGVVTPTTP